mmetsp:Transcript_1990/g.2637  ORF Transcript_1990/g.2637 Transcript_1990/m.2637 type:complete len:463 (-) Transcript_1990:1087-2475(-)
MMPVLKERTGAVVSPDAAVTEKWPEEYANTTLIMSRLKPPPECLKNRSRHFRDDFKKGAEMKSETKSDVDNVALDDVSMLHPEQVDVDKHEKIFDYSCGISRSKLIQTIKILRINKLDAKTQESGLGYMQKVAKLLSCADALIDMGLSKVVVDALRTHPSNADISTISCSLITVLTHIEHVKNAEKSAIVLMRFGAGQAIMKSMKQNMETEEVQYHGLLALYNLTYNSERRRTALRNAEGSNAELATLIVEIMKNHSSKAVQIECCAAISNFQLQDIEQNKKNFIECQAVETVADAISEHGKSEDLVLIACEALNIMYESAPIPWRDRLGEKVKKMLKEQLKDNLNSSDSNIEILRNLLSVLTTYSSHFENRAKFIESGLDKYVVDAFVVGEQDLKVTRLALYLLYLFSFHKKQEAKNFKSLGAVRLVKSAMKNFRDDAYVQNQGRATLQLLKKNGKPNRRG